MANRGLTTDPDARAQALATSLGGGVAREDPLGEITKVLINSAATASFDENGKRVLTPANASDDDEDDTDDPPTGGDSEEEADDEPNTDEPEGDEGGDEDDDGQEADDEYDEVPYDDDDTVEVTVDGKVVTATLRELKAAYSGEGAIERRLQEATETRKAAKAERDAGQQEIATHRVDLLKTIEQLDSVLFMPLVEEPPVSLRTADPGKYYALKEAYEDDQKRIAAGRNGMAAYMQQERQKLGQMRLQYRANEEQLLFQKIPELSDPVAGKKVRDAIMGAAEHYGFTQAQVAQVDNHALFLMARDAARWLEMQKIKESGLVPSGGAKTVTRRRRLKPGTGATTAKTTAVSSQKSKARLVNAAKASGSINDVANMLAGTAKLRKK